MASRNLGNVLVLMPDELKLAMKALGFDPRNEDVQKISKLYTIPDIFIIHFRK